MWCLPEIDAAYVAPMEDLLALYEKPYNPLAAVLCLDQKPVTLQAAVRPPQAARPGVIAKRDSEYKPSGTANVFCAVEPKAGRHFPYRTAHRSGAELAQAIEKLAQRYPGACTIHLVLDKLNIHCRKPVVDRCGEAPGAPLGERFTIHYTPQHGSWLNQAEIEISLFWRQCLGTRRIPDRRTLRAEAKASKPRINRDRVLINW